MIPGDTWIPDDEQIRSLHRRLAPTAEAFELVYRHCQIVCRIAEQLLDRGGRRLDRQLVRAGSLLHDVGVYRLYDPAGVIDHANYVRHGVAGHQLLQELGWPERICRFCSHHTGTGLTRGDVIVQRLPIPVADYLPATEEEELVMYADKFHSKTTPPVFLTPEDCLTGLRRFGPDKAERFTALRTKFGDPDLAPVIGGHADR
ncbi:HD domain-containing protein [Cryptosporangium aurantiacum]|uniref:HD domain-containing protein n=1 Tax=Cryptosporangium aurantiacum TaxID=134849 RepID=A0A1M7RBB7_9ACTN|nr:HD domain-containing protein [Cryptosporangium aurantiacum]SHN43429.1 uncharacterized protein SAMN05443668_109164 [Cryptosporangium aurantiacum]